jgi:hypothetical protein
MMKSMPDDVDGGSGVHRGLVFGFIGVASHFAY